MTLIQVNTNSTLNGHKLLAITPWPFPHDFLGHLHARFPGLSVVLYKAPFGEGNWNDIPEEDKKDVTILVTGTCFPTLEQAPKLQFVQVLSAGADFVLGAPAFKNSNIPFCTANGVHGGILGYGSIGRQVARICKAIGMDVHAYTLHPRKTPESRRDETYTPPGLGDPEGIFPSKWFSGSSKKELHDFLDSGLDLLVLSAPLTKSTVGLISHQEFNILGKKKAFVSNISRGQMINTDAFVEALEGEVIRGAAIDVTDPEPLPDGHKLWTTKNLIITPHVSGATTAYAKRFLAILEDNLERFSQGRKLTNEVSRKDGY
ncbi:D-isomer specific 2-hydroxyacid dehydrogenase [Metarhizium robertsii ARSEF 23]|uniref:D-isomer specific 2-hydroxyacid dehydrogenase n=1 Tax=Metarhizium robertsii (strain ARSEF 23 / ATCC MYA-3075) TaxID=655844 RepID=E9EQE8_METRA|nr:D-isomer specific 2-hydroxyacid dehydrogenase [Metarhizium robertsii ARSEF 23]EFZ02349.1 D-isomer specific 2-hydroxyacid dehydrogenase [Metarhizium robertsii ARSEF 23]